MKGAFERRLGTFFFLWTDIVCSQTLKTLFLSKMGGRPVYLNPNTQKLTFRDQFKKTPYNQVYVADLILVKVVWNAKSSFRLKWNDWHLTYSCWEKVSLKVWKAEPGQRVFASRRNPQCHSGIAEKAQVSCLLFSCKRIFICFLLLFWTSTSFGWSIIKIAEMMPYTHWCANITCGEVFNFMDLVWQTHSSGENVYQSLWRITWRLFWGANNCLRRERNKCEIAAKNSIWKYKK